MWYEYLFSAWHAKTAARRDRDSTCSLHDEEAQRRASTDDEAAAGGGCLLRSCCMSDPAPGEDFPGAGGAAAQLIRRVVQELNDIAIYISITASTCLHYVFFLVHSLRLCSGDR